MERSERADEPLEKKLDSGEKTSSDRLPGEPKCCVGITYFSQALHEHGKLPVCAGLRFRPKLDRYAPNSTEVDSTSVPGGDFKFVCVGYAAYDAEKMRQQQAESKKNPTAPIELPYCEGLEVISAAQLQQSPVVLSTAAGADAAAPPASRPLDEGPVRKPRPLRDTTIPGRMPGENLGDMSVKDFSERVQRTAGKIINKMGVNAQLILDTLKSVIDDGRKGR